MITKDDIQSFLDRLEGGSLTVMEIEPNLWLARTPDDAIAEVNKPQLMSCNAKIRDVEPEREARRGSEHRLPWSGLFQPLAK